MSPKRPPRPGAKRAPIVSMEPEWRFQFEDFVHELAVTPDGTTVAAGGGAGLVNLVRSTDGSTLANFESHFPGLCRMAFSPDSKHLATVGHDGHLRIWDSQTGEPGMKLKIAARGWAEHVTWLSESNLAAAAGKTLKVVALDGSILHEQTTEGTILGLAFTSAPRPALAVATYGGIHIVHTDTFESTTQEWNGALIQPVWSPTGNCLAVGSQEGSVQIWQQNPPDRFEMSGYESKIQNITWDGTGRYMATDGASECAIWDFSGKGPRGQKPIVHSAHRHLISAVAFRPTGIRFATGGLDGLVAVWDVRRPMPGAATLRESPVSRITWLPDGSNLLVGYQDGFVAQFANPREQFS